MDCCKEIKRYRVNGWGFWLEIPTHSNTDASRPSCAIFICTAGFGTPKCNILKYLAYRGSELDCCISTFVSSAMGGTFLSGSSTDSVTVVGVGTLSIFSLFSSTVVTTGSLSNPEIDDSYKNDYSFYIYVYYLLRIQVTFHISAQLTLDSSNSKEASTLCNLFSNWNNFSSQESANLFKNVTVSTIKWFIKAIVLFWFIGGTCNNRQKCLILF